MHDKLTYISAVGLVDNAEILDALRNGRAVITYFAMPSDHIEVNIETIEEGANGHWVSITGTARFEGVISANTKLLVRTFPD